MELRSGFESFFARTWRRRGAVALSLLPVSAAFALLSGARRGLFRSRVLRRVKLTVPVIVVGNITTGGSGKTPLVLWLADELLKRGRKPGIISRGYGGRVRGPSAVEPGADAAEVGDEPLLLARRSRCPVWIGRDRVAAARALLAAHSECDVLLLDDGLQHYRLERDVEIAVLDERGVGNGWLLPAGPLREPVSRLTEVDVLVGNGPLQPKLAALAPACFRMTLIGSRFHDIAHPAEVRGPQAFFGPPVHAVAGIGDPKRFFDHLRALGLKIIEHPFPDHHAFRPGDLRFGAGGPILMTEKDGVKCAGFAPPNTWVLPVQAQLQPDPVPWLLEKIDGRPPA